MSKSDEERHGDGETQHGHRHDKLVQCIGSKKIPTRLRA